MRKVYCIAELDGKRNLYWAYKKDDVEDYIPDIIYQLYDYEMKDIKGEAVFIRWATPHDL